MSMSQPWEDRHENPGRLLRKGLFTNEGTGAPEVKIIYSRDRIRI